MLPPVQQIFEANGSAYLAAVDEMAAATDRLAERIDALLASADRLGASVDAAGALVSAAADAMAESARAATAAQEGLTESETAAGDAARLEAELLADVIASQKLLADSAKVVTDGLAAEGEGDAGRRGLRGDGADDRG